ncbi:hypothetical protein [Marinicellulosiphila megalodicopiae]|uniref:hypothetical protein n=1 Tax=Marinicellulosiphila megalodicopiae TaxID=2724896 RepID=UPI003BAE7652
MSSFSSKEYCKPNFDSTGWVLFLLIATNSLLLLNKPHFISFLIALHYLRRKSPDFHEKCKITLNDKTFKYEILNSDYSTTIEYQKVNKVVSFQERGITFVRIAMENNFELTCTNLNNSEEFIRLILIQADLSFN